MLKFLFLLFLISLFMVFAFGFSVIRFVFRLLFGGWSNKKTMGQQASREQKNKTNYTGTRHKSPKVIPEDEGEYVDYEEVK